MSVRRPPTAFTATCRRSQLRVWAVLGLVACLRMGLAEASAATLPVAALTSREITEYEVKAAYLLRFTRYIEWPAGAFAAPGSPIIIGVLGRNPFGQTLTKTVQAATSQGRPVEFRQLGDLAEAKACHLVFVSREHEREEAAWFRELSNLPVVTVADSLDGLTRGAVLSLFVEDRAGGARVVFGASLPAARTAGVQLSAAMLPSARHIIREPAGKKDSP
ncbi:MAG: YfiR family protein [Verrucomicrobiota bacterium]|nr:YfiR family protein [Verrucomicrobiota bacterium]